MKKMFSLVCLGLLGFFGTGMALKSQPIATYAEEIVEQETYTLVITQPEHGSVKIDGDKTSGIVGETITLDINPDMFYIINSVKVNNNALIESETTKGIYTFNPVAGENVISVEIVLDQALFGEFNSIAEQVKNKDWANLFSVDNVLTIVSWAINSGILVSVVVYFIKDKKLSKKVENATKETIEKIVPEETRKTVVDSVEVAIRPIFEDLKANSTRVLQALAVFSKCFALMQENTAESRKAILDELTSLEIGDLATIEQIKQYIIEQVEMKAKEYAENMANIAKIEEKNTEKANTKEEEEEVKKYDGTEI